MAVFLRPPQLNHRVAAVAVPLLGLLVILPGCNEPRHSHARPPTEKLDLALFMDGAVLESSVEDCTLTDGSKTKCHSITVAGHPANHDVGPFCPPTTSASSELGGIWFDGNHVYDVDGSFILGLAELYGDDRWKLYGEDGNVRITDTPEAFAAAARPDVDPQYQNHCVEGRMEWLENGKPVPGTVLIPASPILAKGTNRAHGNLGVTLNGVVIAASAPVDAILGAYTIAPFDDCGGHINPFDGYHLHGARGCSETGTAGEGETPIFAYAMDGFPIHSPLKGGSTADGLNECQGHTTTELGYHYHAANPEENGVLRCFSGLTVQPNRGEGPPGGRPPGDGPPGGRPPARGE